jgi:hypothetical protein
MLSSPPMRRTAALVALFLAAPAAAQNPSEFVASFGAPGLPDAVAQFVRMHADFVQAPAPAFRTIRFDRLGPSENALALAGHADGISRVRLSLAGSAGMAERDLAVALGGLLFLARTDTARQPGLSDRVTWIARIDAVEGALFPLAPGNRLTLRYVLQEGWYFPGPRPNLAQRFGRWQVEETFEVAAPAADCPGSSAPAFCAGYTIVQSCRADGTMVQDGRSIAAPQLWFCQPRAERHYSQTLGWSWHPAVASPRTLDAVER